MISYDEYKSIFLEKVKNVPLPEHMSEFQIKELLAMNKITVKQAIALVDLALEIYNRQIPKKKRIEMVVDYFSCEDPENWPESFSSYYFKYCDLQVFRNELSMKNECEDHQEMPSSVYEVELEVGRKVLNGAKKGGASTRLSSNKEIRVNEFISLYNKHMNEPHRLPEKEIRKLVAKEMRVSVKTINNYYQEWKNGKE